MNSQNEQQIRYIGQRLSLREPQKRSLQILADLDDQFGFHKDQDVNRILEDIKTLYPSVQDFEREFPSICFALATGVGKTRLMGAFIAYMYRTNRSRHFFVLAPNLTIYNKLIADFTPGTPKYVFTGIADFVTYPPEIVTGDNYEQGRGVRNEASVQQRIWDSGEPHINIFNIAKITSEVRGGNAPRIKRLSEYIGQSYFEYLSALPDLVLLMDESHRYRAAAGLKAINELKPILGLELTATPQIEAGTNQIAFKNVIYSYPLSEAIKDEFVKEPAVATRENFKADNYNQEELERLKLEDGIRVHEDTKVKLDLYARDKDVERKKPFMLVVATDIEHSENLQKLMESDAFFEGRYKGKIITVHSGAGKGKEEKDEIVEKLLTVESLENPIEVVIHVNMLKEGWDVTNLYTIVPLRAANSKTLVEQSIGRGLRLPYGRRTGVASVDRLTIVSHDRYQEIIDESNKADSIIRTGVIIGKDISEKIQKVVESPNVISASWHQEVVPMLTGVDEKPMLFITEEERQAADLTMEAIQELVPLHRINELRNPETQEKITKWVQMQMPAGQIELTGLVQQPKTDFFEVASKVSKLFLDRFIVVPKVSIIPKDVEVSGFRDFDLDSSMVHYQPVEENILIQHLRTHDLERLAGGAGSHPEVRLEDHLVRGLMDKNDINYDQDQTLIYKLAGQLVAHLRSYLKDEKETKNVLAYYQTPLVDLIHGQMQAHFKQVATQFDATVHGAADIMRSRPGMTMVDDEKPFDFRATVTDRSRIRSMVFAGFNKCLFLYQKFDSDPERRFAIMLESSNEVEKWFRPNDKDIRIYLHGESQYRPDFIVEAKTAKYVCEVKAENEMTDMDVQDKARAAALWCKYASEYETTINGKPWVYLLIPESTIDASATFQYVKEAYKQSLV